MSFPALLFDSTLKATILLSAAALLSRILRSRPAAFRHLVWAAALPALLALPLASFRAPSIEVPIPATAVFFAAATSSGQAVRAPLADWMLWIWMVGAAAGFAGLLASAIRLRYMAGPATRLETAGKTRVYCSARATVPMTWGVLRPLVLLPAAAKAWPPDRFETVLAHELSHVRRLDWLMQTIAYVVCALYWFHPLVWYSLRRLRSESELACDDEVLSLGIRSSDYARHLVEIARGVTANKEVVTMAIPMAEKSNLERRILAILDPTVRRAGSSRGLLAAAAALVLCIALPLSTVRAEDSKSAQIKEAVKVEKDVTPPALVKKVEPKYPPDMKDQKIEDSVKMKIVISKEGRVIDVQPISTSANQAFLKAAEDALVQWEFQPGRKAGQPVSVMADVEINFKLQ